MNTENPILENRRICAFINHKGGVAKTTSVANVGARLSQLGYTVLMVDLDAQANLTKHFLNPEAPFDYYIHDAFMNPEKAMSLESINENLYLIPSSIRTAEVEAAIINRKQRETILKKALGAIVSENIFDVILLDCPPSPGQITDNIMTAAQVLIVPITTDSFALEGFKMVEANLQLINEGLNPNLKIDKILITQYNKQTTLSKDVTELLYNMYSDSVLKTPIRNNVAIKNAQTRHMSIYDLDPNCRAAQDYAAATDEILDYLTGRETIA